MWSDKGPCLTRLWHRRAIVLTAVGRRSGLPRTVLQADAADLWHRVVLNAAPDYEKHARRTGRVPPAFRLLP